MQFLYKACFAEQCVKTLLREIAPLILILLKSVHELPAFSRQAGLASIFAAMLAAAITAPTEPNFIAQTSYPLFLS